MYLYFLIFNENKKNIYNFFKYKNYNKLNNMKFNLHHIYTSKSHSIIFYKTFIYLFDKLNYLNVIIFRNISYKYLFNQINSNKASSRIEPISVNDTHFLADIQFVEDMFKLFGRLIHVDKKIEINILKSIG